MRQTKQYYFSVEGYNEKWYFEHLEKLINQSDEAVFNAKFYIKIDKSPISRIKSINIPVYSGKEIPVFHVMDYESNEDEHVKQFKKAVDELAIVKQKYRSYKYKFGYSNFAFELWLMLHKRICDFSVADRSKYVGYINSLYGTNFTKLKDNKNQEAFSKLLEKINLDDVKTAVRNASRVRPYQESIGYRIGDYKGFKYYKENPDLTINECVDIILKECGIRLRWAMI